MRSANAKRGTLLFENVMKRFWDPTEDRRMTHHAQPGLVRRLLRTDERGPEDSCVFSSRFMYKSIPQVACARGIGSPRGLPRGDRTRPRLTRRVRVPTPAVAAAADAEKAKHRAAVNLVPAHRVAPAVGVVPLDAAGPRRVRQLVVDLRDVVPALPRILRPCVAAVDASESLSIPRNLLLQRRHPRVAALLVRRLLLREVLYRVEQRPRPR